MTRAELDQEMRQVLVQLALCSHQSAPSYEPRGRSGATTSVDLSNGDLGATHFARSYGPPFHPATPTYPGCITNDQRGRVLERARGELKMLRGHAVRERPAGETAKQRDARIVKEFEGWSAKEVAIRVRCGVSDVRNARAAADREPDYGRHPAPEPDAEARRARALELKDSGHTLAQIARLLDVSRSTVERDLGKRAA